MELLNKYQAVQHTDGLWSVVEVKCQTLSGSQLIGSIKMIVANLGSKESADEFVSKLNKEK